MVGDQQDNGNPEKVPLETAEDFSRLFQQYYPLLLGVCRLYIKESQESEDLVQDFFIHLWKKRQNLGISSSLKNYMLVAVRNRSLDFIRKKNRTVSFEDTGEEDFSYEAPLLPLEKKEKAELVRRILSQLSPQCRMIFVLVRFENLSYKEVSELLNISIKTVENHMGRALKALRRIHGIKGESLSGDLMAWTMIILLDNQKLDFFLEKALGVLPS
jgi:RNA polymerase sigma-70 factor (ECF subfamily)